MLKRGRKMLIAIKKTKVAALKQSEFILKNQSIEPHPVALFLASLRHEI